MSAAEPGAAPSGGPLRVDERTLALLRCPVTGEPLSGPVEVEGESVLVTPSGVRYPVVDGIPVLLADEARGLPAHLAGGEEDA
ncbi:Trm112 family protein [Kineococcus terrestris]|uniref:Trm112 family protein n=1 Tax=Kineococcus terrestris TaxID=2044856 RepID=UPI0034DB744E